MKQGWLFTEIDPEPRWLPCGHSAMLTEGKGAVVDVSGVSLAVFLVDGVVEVIDGRCPHANAPLGRGWLEGGTVICPLHRWKFDVRSGHCLTVPAKSVRHHRSRVDADGMIWVDATALANETDRADWTQEDTGPTCDS